MEKVRWGIISTAKIGTEQVIPAMQAGKNTEILGIASRNLEAAQREAGRLGIPRSYGSYEALLADADIEAIYNPLPNHLHVPWSIKALEAGKHVLCEKPIALTSQEGQQLVDAAARYPQLKVMEAFMYRHAPQWQKARELVMSGGLGQLRSIQTFFSYYNDDPEDIRNMAAIGGGGLMDIGCYPISVSRFLFDDEPRRVLGWVEFDPTFETDRLASALLEFEAGTSTLTCSTQLEPHQRVLIVGTGGSLEIEIPFNAPVDRPCKIWYSRQGQVEELLLDTSNQYTIQGDLFSRAILDDTEVPTPIADSVANMRVIEAVFQSAAENSWVTL